MAGCSAVVAVVRSSVVWSQCLGPSETETSVVDGARSCSTAGKTRTCAVKFAGEGTPSSVVSGPERDDFASTSGWPDVADVVDLAAAWVRSTGLVAAGEADLVAPCSTTLSLAVRQDSEAATDLVVFPGGTAAASCTTVSSGTEVDAAATRGKRSLTVVRGAVRFGGLLATAGGGVRLRCVVK